MRGALFNTLGDVEGLTFLDAYAGSGALGIEAISRGAKFVQFIDVDKNAIFAITDNLSKLQAKDCKVTQANSASWSDHNFETKFDIVLLDPPYDNFKEAHINKLARNVKENGLMILSLSKLTSRLELENFSIVADKNFADGSIIFYKNNGQNN